MDFQNKKIKILLVENERSFSSLIQLFLAALGYKTVETASSADSGYLIFKSYQPDICIVDINLDTIPKSGILLAENIRAHSSDVALIFLSDLFSEEEYLLCRPLVPSSFLNKELSHLKLYQAIDLALSRKSALARMLPVQEKSKYFLPENFFFKVGEEYKSVLIAQIEYFFASDKLTFAKVDDRNYPTTVQLKTLEQDLKGVFVRIHKTYLVNISKISDIFPSANSLVINHQTLPIGYAYRKSLFEQVFILK